MRRAYRVGAEFPESQREVAAIAKYHGNNFESVVVGEGRDEFGEAAEVEVDFEWLEVEVEAPELDREVALGVDCGTGRGEEDVAGLDEDVGDEAHECEESADGVALEVAD